ncbi:MAG TPA: DUF362 domain-containing protein [Bacteroidales bacterium]|nr:DUF362 domain-containing protein [Bacteroidales bacterium]
MKRREFIGKSLGATLLAGAGLSLGTTPDLFASESSSSKAGSYDLVAVRGGEPEVMLDKALEALGGMQKFVKKGQKVVVKPNIGWDKSPEFAATTNPALVKRIIEHVYKAGAKEVIVFDFTCDNPKKCYENSGIKKAVEEAGGVLVSGNNEADYKPVSVPKGIKLKEAKEHKQILDADVVINVPVLKSHQGSTVTISMKNLMGIIWDRGYWHRNDLHQCIADFATYRKPTLNIVDAYRVMMKNGPKGVSVSDVKLMKSLIVSTDIVAADAAATKLFGLEPRDIDHIRIAHEMGVGNMNLDKLNIARLTV